MFQLSEVVLNCSPRPWRIHLKKDCWSVRLFFMVLSLSVALFIPYNRGFPFLGIGSQFIFLEVLVRCGIERVYWLPWKGQAAPPF